MNVGSFIMSTTGKDDPRFLDLYPMHGKSAYQAAVENGFMGTEEEWLANMFELRFGTVSSFTDKMNALLYVDTEKNYIYRYDSIEDSYIPLSAPLGETELTAYRGDRGKAAYEHSLKDHDFLFRKGGSMTGDINSMNILPKENNKYSLGSAEMKYQFIHANTFVGKLSGNADSASKLQSTITINGTLFNGTDNIVTEMWGVKRTIVVGSATHEWDGSSNLEIALDDIGAAPAEHYHLYAASATSGGSALSANKLTSARTITISGAVNGSITFDGGSDVEIKTTVNHTHSYAGSTSAGGAANSALKLTTAIMINGTEFNGSKDITTEKWGIGRNFYISDNAKINKGAAIPVTGESDVTLLLPEIIKATLKGHADSATKASQDGNGNVIVDTYVSKTDFINNNKSIASQIETRVPNTRTINSKELSDNIELTATDVGADVSGTAVNVVTTHNTEESAHNDIRLLIAALDERITSLLDSDDETLDQMSEIVTYLKNNKSLIDSITTTKVNISDIVNNLITNVTNKPLSAAQGVVLKSLIDALQTQVDKKLNQTDFTMHVTYPDLHIDPAERKAWNMKADLTDNVASATKLETARNISIGNTSKSFDGTIDLSWSLADIGAFSVNGGTLNGNVDSMSIYPIAASTYALGSASKMFKEVHTNELNIYSGTSLAGRFYTNGDGISYLEIGNTGSYGKLVLKNQLGVSATIIPQLLSTTNETYKLPSNGGTLATLDDIDNKINALINDAS